MVAEVHKGDIGTVFEATIVDEDSNIIGLDSATTKEIKFKKPISGTTITKTASFVTDGKDGKIQYTTILGDLDEAGIWKIQGFVILPTGEWNTDIQDEFVFDNL